VDLCRVTTPNKKGSIRLEKVGMVSNVITFGSELQSKSLGDVGIRDGRGEDMNLSNIECSRGLTSYHSSVNEAGRRT
jgi:hypothetical protein